LVNEIDDAVGQLGGIKDCEFMFKTLTKLNAKQKQQLRSRKYWLKADPEPQDDILKA